MHRNGIARLYSSFGSTAATLALLLSLASGFQDCRLFDLQPNVSLYADDCRRGTGESNLLETFVDIVNLNPLMKSLVLKNIPISKIPREMCHLKNLKVLVLESINIEELPRECFVRLVDLEEVTITHNRINFLQVSEFSGLNKLATLKLNSNGIHTVGESILSNTSDLVSLKSVYLHTNRLQTVGPWPVIRGISTYGFIADLSNNNISSFTNDVGWKFQCKLSEESSISFTFNLRSNRVQHLMDLVEAFFGETRNFICIHGDRAHTNVSIILEENMMWCDCKDYYVKKILLVFARIHMLDSARCRGPEPFKHKRFLSIPLEETICDHTGTPSCIDGCRCAFSPYGKQFVVDCSLHSSSFSPPLTTLPQSLCPLKNISKSPNMGYNISFSGNDIAVLKRRDYFRFTKALDLSFARLRTIDDDVFESLKKVKVLNLGGNLLRTLPKSIVNVDFAGNEMILHGNLWSCDCENVWFKAWLMATQSKIKNYDSVYCTSPEWLIGRMIVKVEDHEFCHDPRIKQRRQIVTTSLVSIFAVVTVVVIILILLKRFKVQLHAYLNIHPFDRDECHGENMMYDAFVSSSFCDRKFAIELVQFLETKSYRVCYHEKDFIGGQTIVENICQAIANSKRVVCYLTKSFVESQYCMYEFQSALHRNIQTKRQRLIALVDESLIIKQSFIPDDVYQFLTSHTYVMIKARNNWKSQLLYSLAINKLGNACEQSTTGADVEV